MRKVTLALAAALLAMPGLAEAQQGTAQRTLVDGRRSIVFEWPLLAGTAGGHGRLEAWQMYSPNTNLGLVLEAAINRRTLPGDATEREIFIAVGPAIKRYMSIQQTVAPYIRGHLLLGYFSEVTPADVEVRGWGILLGGGVGVEWFPWDRIGIGGFTGLDLAFDQDRLIRPNLPDATSTNVGIFTRTSGLQVLIYF
jgi:hypothetical protein